MHRLSNVDPQIQIGICAECGPVRVRRAARGKNKDGVTRYAWRCNKNLIQQQRKRKKGYKYAKREECKSCERCGREHPNQSFFDIHHKDHNHSNNANDNIEMLCPNCHREEHLK